MSAAANVSLGVYPPSGAKCSVLRRVSGFGHCIHPLGTIRRKIRMGTISKLAKSPPSVVHP